MDVQFILDIECIYFLNITLLELIRVGSTYYELYAEKLNHTQSWICYSDKIYSSVGKGYR